MPVVQDEISLVKVANGDDGRGILGTPVATYAQSTSGTTPPTTWSATRPNVPAGQYLWTRVVTTYTDNTTSETQTPTLMGAEGESGLGIKDKSISYAVGTSGNTPPTSGWQETIPTVSANQYLWTKTTLIYTDESKTEAYSVGKMGANGADAKLLYLTASAENMAFNADDTPKTTQTINISAKLQNVTGTATFTAIPYIGNTAQTAITLGGTGNTRTLTSAQWTNKNWTLIAITATLDNLSDTLSIVKVKDGATGDKGDQGNQGIPGTPGADGKTPYTHWAYAWSSDGTDRFTTTYPNENLLFLKNASFGSFPLWTTGKDTTNSYKARAATDYLTVEEGKEYYIRLSNPEGYTISAFLFKEKGVDAQYRANGNSNLVWGIPDSSGASFTPDKLLPKIPSGMKYLRLGFIKSSTEQSSFESISALKPKLEETKVPTIYTPAPADDFANAYPTFAGTYTDYEPTDSEDPSKYTWQRFMGNQGKDGEDGISIIGVEVQYAQTTTSTEPTSGWSYTRPTPIPGQYLWTRTRNKFSDGTFGSWATFPTMIGRDAIVVSEIAPANPSIGTLWQKPSDPNVQKWNGTKWENWGIAPENIVADNLVVKDGRFEKLVGAELESGTITNSFDFWDGSLVPNTSAQMWRRGKTTIKNAEVTTLWEDYNKSTGAKVKEGGVIHDSDGTSVYINDPSNFNQTASYRSSGILLRDSRVPSNVSGSFLTYNDLLIYPATAIPPASGWAAYSTSPSNANYPAATRNGRNVQLTGAFKNNTALTDANTTYVIGILPVGLRPAVATKYIQKSNGNVIFMVTINTNGEIAIDYRLGWAGSAYGFVSSNAGSIFNIAGSFVAADI